MISKTSFVVVDLETTGLHAGLDSIVEIAAVRVVNGEVVDEWDTTVNPGVFLPQECTQITGITTEMVADAPLFADIVDDYLRFMGEESVFVAHNVDFDWTFLNKQLLSMQRAPLNNPYLCTFKLAKLVHPNLSKYGLGSLCMAFGVDLPQAHRALHDARATAHLLIKFLRVLQNGGLKELKDIPHIQNLPKEVAKSVQGQVSLF
ncbi:MAG: 3'-5' exonuclease [Candidatus Gracilibacteria bacterium]|jgi:DNA polymerase III epsilon subunit family exonuclease